jgi:hypothetical protein
MKKKGSPHMRSAIVCLSGLVFFTACATDARPSLIGGTNDVFLLSPESTALLAPTAARGSRECRARISRILCLKRDADMLDPTCLDGGEIYAARFEALYDAYPPVLQRVFCSLSRINVVPGFFGTAFAGLDRDESGELRGATLGVRKAFLDAPLSQATWATWKDQLNFGGTSDPTQTPRADLPEVVVQQAAPDMLTFVVAHEFGHILDFANGANALGACQEDAQGNAICPFAQDSWGAISWQAAHFIKPTQEDYGRVLWVARPDRDFPMRERLCFYFCNSTTGLNRADVPQLYQALDASAFISAYASTNPADDFAETVAYRVWEQLPAAQYTLDTRQGTAYDVLGKLHTPQFASKLEYVQKFVARDDLRYPAPPLAD